MLLIWIKEFIKFTFKRDSIKAIGRMKVEMCHGQNTDLKDGLRARSDMAA